MPQRTIHRLNQLGIAILLIAALLLSLPISNAQTGRRRNEPTQTRQTKPALPVETATQEQIPKPTAAWLLASPNPLSVTPVVSQQGQVTRHISADLGGTIEAKGADGTIFTLTLPKSALAEDVEIAITPVSAIQNLPFSQGLIAAAQIAPADVSLARAATLTIQPTKPLSIQEQILLASFAYREGGKEFFLYPLEADPSKLSFKLNRFGGLGLAHSTEAEQENVREHIPTDPTDRLFMQIEKWSRLLRQRRLRQTGQTLHAGQNWRVVKTSFKVINGYQESDGESMLDIYRRGAIALREMYHQQVIPQLKALMYDCRSNMLLRAREAISTADGWKRGVDLLDLRNEQNLQDVPQAEFETIRIEFRKLYDDLDSLIDAAFRRAYETAYQCCVQEGKPHHLQMMDTINRIINLRGMEDFTSFEKREKCACTVGSVTSQVGTWQGEITHTETFDDKSSSTISGNNHQRIISWHRKLDYRATFTLEYNFRSSNLSSGLPVQVHAVGESIDWSSSKEIDGRCDSEFTTDFTVGDSLREKKEITVAISPTGTYYVTYTLPCIPASGQSTSNSSVSGSGCNAWTVRQHTWTKSGPREQPICPTSEGPGITGRIDPNNPGEISGTATMTKPLPENKSVNKTIVVTWHLTRCR